MKIASSCGDCEFFYFPFCLFAVIKIYPALESPSSIHRTRCTLSNTQARFQLMCACHHSSNSNHHHLRSRRRCAAITPPIKNSSRKFHSSLHSIVLQLCRMECKEVWSDQAYATHIFHITLKWPFATMGTKAK